MVYAYLCCLLQLCGAACTGGALRYYGPTSQQSQSAD